MIRLFLTLSQFNSAILLLLSSPKPRAAAPRFLLILYSPEGINHSHIAIVSALSDGISKYGVMDFYKKRKMYNGSWAKQLRALTNGKGSSIKFIAKMYLIHVSDYKRSVLIRHPEISLLWNFPSKASITGVMNIGLFSNCNFININYIKKKNGRSVQITRQDFRAAPVEFGVLFSLQWIY